MFCSKKMRNQQEAPGLGYHQARGREDLSNFSTNKVGRSCVGIGKTTREGGGGASTTPDALSSRAAHYVSIFTMFDFVFRFGVLSYSSMKGATCTGPAGTFFFCIWRAMSSRTSRRTTWETLCRFLEGHGGVFPRVKIYSRVFSLWLSVFVPVLSQRQ